MTDEQPIDRTDTDTDGNDCPETLAELRDKWRQKADTLIHEGETEFIEGRGGQLAECARQLERFVNTDTKRSDTDA